MQLHMNTPTWKYRFVFESLWVDTSSQGYFKAILKLLPKAIHFLDMACVLYMSSTLSDLHTNLPHEVKHVPNRICCIYANLGLAMSKARDF